LVESLKLNNDDIKNIISIIEEIQRKTEKKIKNEDNFWIYIVYYAIPEILYYFSENIDTKILTEEIIKNMLKRINTEKTDKEKETNIINKDNFFISTFATFKEKNINLDNKKPDFISYKKERIYPE
jgi:hypothetical protein